jgi:hypothetical protein
MHSGVGVVAWVSMVGASVLLLLLLLVLVLLPLSLRCLCLMCFGGRRQGARLVVVSRKWRVMMLPWLISLAFYPLVGVSRDIFLSAAELGRYQQAPTYCHSLGIPST